MLKMSMFAGIFVAFLPFARVCAIVVHAAEIEHDGINILSPIRDGMIPDADYEGPIQWNLGRAPDYSSVNLQYLSQKKNTWGPGSLQEIVSNLIKTFEMEAMHKPDPTTWVSIDSKNEDGLRSFWIQANNGPKYNLSTMAELGTYNVLMNACPESHKMYFNSANYTREDSISLFKNAFLSGFIFEVLDVYTGPPEVTFSWRHWGHMTGEYHGYRGSGQLIEMFGMGTAHVYVPQTGEYEIERLRIKDVQVWYDVAGFLEKISGHHHHKMKKDCRDCPEQQILE